MIFYRKGPKHTKEGSARECWFMDFEDKVNFCCFPHLFRVVPTNHQIGALAVLPLKQGPKPLVPWPKCQRKVKANAVAPWKLLEKMGPRDTSLLLKELITTVFCGNLDTLGLTGLCWIIEAATRLKSSVDLANITVNKNAVFGDSRLLCAPGGVRIGTSRHDFKRFG
ncbi:hypothetical protein NC652_004800 [Populus alba x Populus x berolinensis]|nr:hypothetical protein NC652_004800 [Populus alba x Populus x berolinensis]